MFEEASSILITYLGARKALLQTLVKAGLNLLSIFQLDGGHTIALL